MPPDARPVDFAAAVAEDERETVLAAARRLSLCLGDPNEGWPVRVRFTEADAISPGPSAMLLLSLRADADAMAASPESIAGRLERRISAARAAGHAAILIPTLFRHASRRDEVEPIRRLNLIAVGLSRALGVQIVDLDRIFALVGARALGSAATEVAGHAIVAAILASGLDGIVPPERQEQAAIRNGGSEAVAAIVAAHAKEPA